MVVNSNDSAVDRPRQPGQRLCLETLHVDLDERRHAVRVDQRVERGHRHDDRLVPDLALPALRALAASMNALDAVETVGLSMLIFISSVPGARPTALLSMITLRSRP